MIVWHAINRLVTIVLACPCWHVCTLSMSLVTGPKDSLRCASSLACFCCQMFKYPPEGQIHIFQLSTWHPWLQDWKWSHVHRLFYQSAKPFCFFCFEGYSVTWLYDVSLALSYILAIKVELQQPFLLSSQHRYWVFNAESTLESIYVRFLICASTSFVPVCFNGQGGKYLLAWPPTIILWGL